MKKIFAFLTAFLLSISMSTQAQTTHITLNWGHGGHTMGSATATFDSNTLTNLTHVTTSIQGAQLLGYYQNASYNNESMKVINADGTLVPNSGFTDADGKWKCTNENITLYALFNIYSLIYRLPSLDGTGYSQNYVDNPNYYVAAPGTSIPLIDADVPGFEFQGWYLEETFETQVNAIDRGWAPTNTNRIIRLYGKLSEPITYTLSYSIPDGVAAPSPANPTTYTIADVPLTLNAPGAREHYTFTYWKTDENNLLLNHQITRNNLGNYTLTAGWSPVNYTFTVHCQQGMAVYNLLYDEVIHGGPITDTADWVYTLPYQATVQLTLDYNNCNHDYTFDGLEIIVDGDTVSNFEGIFESSENVSDNRAGWLTIVGNTTITFKSTNSVYNIGYSYLPGKIDHCDPDPDFPDDRTKDHCVLISDYWQNPDRLTQTFICDSDEPINTIRTLAGTEDATHGGGAITFEGWYTDAALTDTVGYPAIPAHTHFTSLPHFYAKWNAPIQYRDQGGAAYSGSMTGLPVNDYWCGPDVALPAPATRIGYTFGGWYDNSECTGDPITVVPDDYAFRLSNSNLPVVYAKWIADTYDVTYDKGANGTGSIDAGTKTHDVNFTLSSSTFTREGYTQTGWSTSDGGDKAYDLGGTYTANEAVTLYPFWTVNSHTLTWVANGGTLEGGTAAGTTDYGTSLTPPTATRDGYIFAGWSPEVPATMPDEDATYTATWTLDIFELLDNKTEGDSYYNTYQEKVDAGTAIDIRYVRSFTAGRWATFALPFSYSYRNEANQTFRGQVYQLVSSKYEKIGNDAYLTLNCMPATSGFVANKPYILIPTVDIENPVFENVKLKDIAENPYTVSDLSGTGTVKFVNTTYRQRIDNNGDHRVIFLQNNQLHYPGGVVNMNAFRGYFYMEEDYNPIYHSPVRVRIVNDKGEQIETLPEEAEETPAEVKKYIEDGILIIERAGIKYDAKGHKLN
ncbi:MAG: InlB B-repeat-containing protein [Paludibacteraceae bacterium]|nr:InlB B-repeat-containing protein [Paludibacteraceae bacterium]